MMTVTDGTNDIMVYSSTALSSLLDFNFSNGQYTISNPTDFLENQFTKNIAIGDKLDLMVVRSDYSTTKQLTAIIRSVNGRVIPNNANVMTTDQFTAVQPNEYNSYLVKGVIDSWVGTNTDATYFGNYYLKSSGSYEDAIRIYGSSANEAVRYIDPDTGKLVFSHFGIFLTDEYSKDLTIGSEVTMILKSADYSTGEGVIYLENASTSIAISGDATVEAGGKDRLSASFTYSTDDISNMSVTWKSSDESVATVDRRGIVTGVAEGNVTITATSVNDSTIKGTIDVEVTANDPLKAILDTNNLVMDSEATIEDVTWSTSSCSNRNGALVMKTNGTIANIITLPYGVKSISLEFSHDTAYVPADSDTAVFISLGDTADCGMEADYVKTKEGQYSFTFTPTVSTYKFIKIVHDNKLVNLAWDSITLNLAK